MAYWLLKSEPSVFSIDDLEQRGISLWDGVRNYQARNFLRAMQAGDEAFFYHSSCPEPGIAGIMTVARAAHPDPTQFNPDSPYHDPKSSPDAPRWDGIDVCFSEKFNPVIPLAALKAAPALAGLALVQKGSRLSVMPVSAAEWKTIRKLAGR
ncbi:MAG: RNA-binding protein [Moraxellaceae bacterium]|jgi:predicted RNA-binding protein with PUA-like domain|nr:RNA-binding protein [Moraxellaceae bacterium]